MWKIVAVALKFMPTLVIGRSKIVAAISAVGLGSGSFKEDLKGSKMVSAELEVVPIVAV